MAELLPLVSEMRGGIQNDSKKPMKIIPIKLRNKKASVPCMVDDWDYDVLKKVKWHINSAKNKPSYARTSVYRGKQKTSEQMHRIIMWSPKGMEIDHIDGNGLNNQKSNLRVCTRSQNRMNKGKGSNNTSGYKGVTWDKQRGRWRAKITKEGKTYNLGKFDDIKEAAVVYQKAAIEIHQEFSRF